MLQDDLYKKIDDVLEELDLKLEKNRKSCVKYPDDSGDFEDNGDTVLPYPQVAKSISHSKDMSCPSLALNNISFLQT